MVNRFYAERVWQSRLVLLALWWCSATLVNVPARLSAQLSQPDNERISGLLAAGEFAAARALVAELPSEAQGEAKAAIAKSLMNHAMTGAAAKEIASIVDPQIRQSILPQLAGNNGLGLPGSSSSGSGYDPALPAQDSGTPARGAGGGVIADFTQLMNLIQTTIAPDQWEALGGPSTMFPYPSGIYVDPKGLVKDIEIDSSNRMASLLTGAINEVEDVAVSDNFNWTRPSEFRIVSLRRLRDSLARNLLNGSGPTLSMQNLAGLSEIKYVVVDGDDVLLAGTVGGVDPAATPWPRDRISHRTTLGLDLLVAAAHSVRSETPFGCTIDPTQQGLAAAARVSESIAARRVPTATAAEALGAALGTQEIKLFNLPGNKPLAWLLIDADRHMKQLALGQHPMPRNVPNYLDIVDQTLVQHPEQGVPSGQLLRMWFAVQPKQVRKAADSLTFEVSGQPIRLLTSKEFEDENGGRKRMGEDPLGKQFAEAFNQHFATIAAMYPVYDRLRGAFELTAVMQLVKTQTGSEAFATLLGELSDQDILNSYSSVVAVPKSCDSLAVRHTIRTPTKRHEVYFISGGVLVDPTETLVSHIDKYPVLDDLGVEIEDAPIQNTRWWWDR